MNFEGLYQKEYILSLHRLNASNNQLDLKLDRVVLKLSINSSLSYLFIFSIWIQAPYTFLLLQTIHSLNKHFEIFIDKLLVSNMLTM